MSAIIPRIVRYMSYSGYTETVRYWNDIYITFSRYGQNNTGSLIAFWWVSPLYIVLSPSNSKSITCGHTHKHNIKALHMVSKEIINNNKVYKGICVLKWKRFHFYVVLIFFCYILQFLCHGMMLVWCLLTTKWWKTNCTTPPNNK